jgi:hypothetical protein
MTRWWAVRITAGATLIAVAALWILRVVLHLAIAVARHAVTTPIGGAALVRLILPALLLTAGIRLVHDGLARHGRRLLPPAEQV